jgi:hypothetical protein
MVDIVFAFGQDYSILIWKTYSNSKYRVKLLIQIIYE